MAKNPYAGSLSPKDIAKPIAQTSKTMPKKTLPPDTEMYQPPANVNPGDGHVLPGVGKNYRGR